MIEFLDKHKSKADSKNRITAYYRLHSTIYDVTRWLFLFGRQTIIQSLPTVNTSPKILEVGCGTGTNLIHLYEKYPGARLTGIDISKEMLSKARNKIKKTERPQQFRLIHDAYGSSCLKDSTFDLILCSYSLTMMGPDIEYITKTIKRNLEPDGVIAVTDFHQTTYNWFEEWMKINHVAMDGSLYKTLKQQFQPTQCNIQTAYFNWWQYFTFIGKKD